MGSVNLKQRRLHVSSLGGGKPLATTKIQRCPAGWELVMRVNGRLGCAKYIVPPSDN
jgi:hypothetical protein